MLTGNQIPSNKTMHWHACGKLWAAARWVLQPPSNLPTANVFATLRMFVDLELYAKTHSGSNGPLEVCRRGPHNRKNAGGQQTSSYYSVEH